MIESVPGLLPGLVVIRPAVFGDDRGWFLELWNRTRCAESGLPAEFVQDNVSWSRRGVLRGLHFQNPGAQGKLVSVLAGAVFDVAVDLRRGSPTFGRWHGLELSAENRRQFYIPEGFAHGFQVVGESALVAYKCTQAYQPQHDHTLRWDDPDVGVAWPLGEPVVSAKDAAGRRLRDLPPEWLY